MANITVISRTQKIIVNPSTHSVSVINAGPQGPQGIQGVIGPRNFQFVQDTPPTAISPGDQWFNSTNGREYVWYDGFWVEIGTSFQGSFLTVDGNLATRAAGVASEITRANLAADTAFTSKYTQVINHGAVAGQTRLGTAPVFWIGSVNPTDVVNNDRLYRTDTTGYYVRVAGAWVESGSSRYGLVVNHGATAGTARTGVAPIFWIGSVNPTNATDNDTLYRTDQTAQYVRVSSAWVEVGSSRYAPLPRVGFSAQRVANQAIPNNTVTALLFDTENIDSNAFFAPTSATGAIPAGLAGTYAITIQVIWASPPGVTSWVSVSLNGGRQATTNATGDSIAGATLVMPLSVGWTIGALCYQISGAPLNVTGAIHVTRISV